MSQISDKATVTLNINGKQAKKMLAELEQDIQKTSLELTKLETTVGDTKETRKKRSELKMLQRQWEDMNSAMKGVDDVMQKLDRVSLGQLDKSLKSLQKSLRGTAQDAQEFDEINNKMRLIKEQIEKVRGASDTQRKSMEEARNVLKSMDTASVKDLQKAYNTVNKELEDAKQGTAEYKRLQAEAKLLKDRLNEVKGAANESGTSMSNVNRTLKNLDKASMQDLDKALTRLNQDLRKVKPGTKEFEDLSAKVRKVKEQMEANRRATDLSVASMREVSDVLKNIDKATPRQLEKSLKTMREQFKDLRKGTAEYERMAKAIRDVERRLNAVNSETRQQESLWSKMSNWWFKSGQAVAALVAGITAAVMSLREIVNKFATMEEALANTRKYTRMTEQDVLQLNEAFKKMDTRTGREQLNLLAQEGGRLGKNTIETVREYVEAADIINVALVDLGAGATQQIAKIANIFRIEDLYGVREGMLKVGSTVNVLSQNCTAAKPYIVEFTKRMSGIGVQAGMTVPEIMAFAATLDAAGQKCEMSASAVSRTLMMLFQKPREIAQTMKMDVDLLEKTLKKNSTQGLLMFLDRLHEIGKDNALAALAPLFKEMGMNGIRLSQVLATLADKTDFLRWEINEANKAFREGTSATSEFEIFNNTVQASIEKAKYRFHELAVELGSYLAPYMKHLLTSSSALVRVLLTVVKFAAKYRVEIVSLTSVIAAYTVAANIAAIRTKAMAAAQALATAATATMNVAVKACALVMALFSGNIGKVTIAWKALSVALSMSPLGLVAAAVAALVAGLGTLIYRTREAKKEQERLNKAQEEFRKGLREISSVSEQESAAERNRLRALYKAATDYNTTQEERYKAAEKLQKLYPETFSNFDREAVAAGVAEKAYADLAAQILQTARVKAAADKIVANEMASQPKRDALEGLERKKAIHEGNLVQAETYMDDALKRYRKGKGKRYSGKQWETFVQGIKSGRLFIREFKDYRVTINSWRKAVAEDTKAIDSLKAEIAEYDKANDELYKFAGLTHDQVDAAREENARKSMGMRGFEQDEVTDPMAEGFTLDKKDKKYDPLTENLDRRRAQYEKEHARLETQYALGYVSYEEYLQKKYELDLRYAEDRLRLYDRYDHREAERANVQAKESSERAKVELELAKLQSERKAEVRKMEVKDLEGEQSKELDELKLQYEKAGSVVYKNEHARAQKEYEIRLGYLEKMRDIYKKGSKDYEEYDRKIAELMRQRQIQVQQDMTKAFTKYMAESSTADIDTQFEAEKEIITELMVFRKISMRRYYDWMLRAQLEYNEKLKAALDKQEKERNTISSGSISVDIRGESGARAGEAEKLRRDRDDAMAIAKEKHNIGILSEEEYNRAVYEIARKYNRMVLDDAVSQMDEQTRMLLQLGMAWQEFYTSLRSDGKVSFEDVTSAARASLATISAGLDMATQFLSVQYDIQAAKVEKRYEKEIEAAKGNTNKVKRLEEQRDKELEAIKREQSKKEFAVNVIKAVAQTAQNALMAYGAMVGIPVIGPTLAAAAAATATAMGMIQVALLKKQQQLAEAQGYSEGGFTKPGGVDEPAGIVHAGEWVASQKLLKSPVARPIIEALDCAQRTNTVGTIGTKPYRGEITVGTRPMEKEDHQALIGLVMMGTEAIGALNDRLKEPFFTVNSVTGPLGYKRAEDEYLRMINNKKPKR